MKTPSVDVKVNVDTSQLTKLLTTTRLDLAMRAYTHATARMRALEVEAAAAFREYHDARQRLADDHNVTCDMTLAPGIDAAYAVHKRDLEMTAARLMARQVVR